MSQKLKIVPEGSGYVGYVLRNDEVVFQTSVCKDTISCSRELSRFVASKQPNPVPVQRSNHVVQAPSASATQAPGPRRCCGRG